MSQDYRYFSWRVGLALLIAGILTLIVLSAILWLFFSSGQAWLAERRLSILILPASALMIVGLGIFWFRIFVTLMLLFGAENE